MTNKKGLLALSPLLLFLGIFLVSSIIAKDFYKIPITAAFMIAACYSLLVPVREKNIETRVDVFAKGIGEKNIILMIWIFLLAGTFAGTAKDIGSIEATVNLVLHILPPKMIFASLFIASCMISMAIGTSIGTIVALVPLSTGIANQAGIDLAILTSIIVGGAFFGDNLSFISDTTIVATKTQGCKLIDKFKANVWIAAPAAIITTIIYIISGSGIGSVIIPEEIEVIKVIPYLMIIVMALLGMNVLVILTIGIFANFLVAIFYDHMGWADFLSSIGGGINSVGDLIIITLLAGGMLAIIRHNGGLNFILEKLSRRIKGKRSAEFSIASIVSLINICIANNTIAIFTCGDLAKDISNKFGLDSRRTASLIDSCSCIVQSLLPYGAQMLMASGLAGISTVSILSHLYYTYILLAFVILSVIFRYPRKYCK